MTTKYVAISIVSSKAAQDIKTILNTQSEIIQAEGAEIIPNTISDNDNVVGDIGHVILREVPHEIDGKNQAYYITICFSAQDRKIVQKIKDKLMRSKKAITMRTHIIARCTDQDVGILKTCKAFTKVNAFVSY